MKNRIAKLLVFAGLLIIIVSTFLLWRRNDPNRLSFEVDYEQPENETELAVPTGLAIEKLKIKAPIIKASKVGETTGEGVSFLATTPYPGQEGNSILYGHNWGSILGKLHKAKPGQIIQIYHSNGEIKLFEIATIQEVAPKDTSVLAPTSDNRITLYTCSGIFDQKRIVVTAFLI